MMPVASSRNSIPASGHAAGHAAGHAEEHGIRIPSAAQRVYVTISTLTILPLLQVAVYGLGTERTLRLVARMSQSRLDSGPRITQAEARGLAAVVRSVCRRWPFNTGCLHQALMNSLLLRRCGVDVEVFNGFRRDQGEIVGHAWIEVEGTPIAETVDVRRLYPDRTRLGF